MGKVTGKLNVQVLGHLEFRFYGSPIFAVKALPFIRKRKPRLIGMIGHRELHFV
jgi:hypothetical protein